MAITLDRYFRRLEQFMTSFPEQFGYPLEDPFDEITAKLTNRRSFSFARYGDGEFYAILGADDENCDGHHYYPELGLRLREILETRPTYIMGLQPLAVMRHGVAPILAHSEGIHWKYSDSLHTAMAEDRLGLFFDALQAREIALVGPPHLQPLSRAKGWLHVPIPSKNCWLHYDEVKRTVMDSISIRGSVVLFCASMMSNVLIDDLYGWQPDNAYIDIGSVFDPCVGINSRPFYEELTPPFLLSERIE